MKSFCSFTLTASLFFCLSLVVSAQEDATETAAQPVGERLSLETDDMERPVMKNITLNKKITGRLPNGYKPVITESQRDEIYKIQKEYGEVIERLKLRIEMLESERNQKVDALLTTDQANRIRTTLGSLESEKQHIRGERTVPNRRNRRTAQSTE